MSDEKIIIDPDEEDISASEDAVCLKKTLRILTFSLGRENYCVGLDQVKEVIQPSGVTQVPNSPDFVEGVINLDGEIIAILDIRYFFGLGEQEKSKDIKILITDVTGSCVGIIVDKVNTIVEIEEEAIQPPLVTLKGKLADYTKGEIQLGDDIFALLDLNKILNSEAISDLKKGGN